MPCDFFYYLSFDLIKIFPDVNENVPLLDHGFSWINYYHLCSGNDPSLEY